MMKEIFMRTLAVCKKALLAMDKYVETSIDASFEQTQNNDYKFQGFSEKEGNYYKFPGNVSKKGWTSTNRLIGSSSESVDE